MYRIITNASGDKLESIEGILKEIYKLIDINPSLAPLIKTYLGVDELPSLESKKISEAIAIKLRAFAHDVLLTKAELDQMYSDFKDHYSVEHGLPDEVFKDVWVNWRDLLGNINNANEAISLAYKFIHRYDSARGKWFLSAQQKQLQKYDTQFAGTDIPFGNGKDDIYEFDETGKWSLTDKNANLKLAYDSYYDPLYQMYVNGYDVNGGSPYRNNDRVWSAILPAQELQMLIHHNLNDSVRTDNLEVNFRSITYEIINAGESGARANVKFPHCVAAYVSRNRNPKLDSGAVVVGAVFQNRGANLDSLCPPSCNSYYWPVDLPF